MSLSLVLFFLLVTTAEVDAQRSEKRISAQDNFSEDIRAEDNDLYRIAKVQGYNDGLKRAAKDARKKRKNPLKSAEYKNGANGFKIYYGKQRDYKRVYAGGNKLYKQAYDEKRKSYQKAYRDGFLEGFNKADNGSRVGVRTNVTVRKKRNVFGRIKRFILRN